MKKKYFNILFLLTLLACQKAEVLKQQVVENIPEETKIDDLLQKIRDIQYVNVVEMRRMAIELATYKSEKAQVLGTYYQLKADFFSSDVIASRANFALFYEKIKDKEAYESIALEIDMLLTSSFYKESLFSEASVRIRNSMKYILKPEYELERAVFVYGLTAKSLHYDDDNRLSEIKEAIENTKERPWSVYHTNLHLGLALTYIALGQSEEAHKVFELVLKKNEENKLLSESCYVYNRLANIAETEDKISLAKKSIALALKTGRTSDIMMFYRVAGHAYMGKKNFEKAYEYYQKALNAGIHYDTKASMAVDYAYLGWAFFKMNPPENFDKAMTYFDKSIEISGNKFLIPKKIVLERKSWALGVVGRKEEARKVQEELKFMESIQQNEEARLADYFLYSVFEMKGKESEIKNLKVANELREEKILRQRLMMWFFLLLGLWILYYYRQKHLAMKKLDQQKAIIETQNNEMKLLIRKLENSNRDLENFASVAAHDLKSPLHSISGFTELLRSSCKESYSETEEMYFDSIAEVCFSLSSIIEDLLKFSSLTQNLPELEDVNLNHIVGAIQKNLKGTTTLRADISITVCANLPAVEAHESLILQLFMNLLNNSIKYSEADRANNITIHSEGYDSNYWLIEIRDTGIGIAEEQQEEVFKMFKKIHKSSEYEGTGIGLATCKRIVENYGGKMWVKSALGVGTQMYFTLPKKVAK